MVFGHNSNVAIGENTLHVQTEDRGGAGAIIDTTVHWKGRVLYRRTNSYKDLLPLDAGKEATVKERVDQQHRGVVDELSSGALALTIPSPAAPSAVQKASRRTALKVDLTNAGAWLSGRNATLQLLVRDGAGNPVGSATLKARIEGAVRPFESSTETGPAGIATLQFQMPKLSGADPALVIEAAHNGAQGNLRFQLRAKPKT